MKAWHRFLLWAILIQYPISEMHAQACPSPPSAVLSQWTGMTSENPQADPHGAAGPNGVIQTVNSYITYWNKSGTAIWGPLFLPSWLGGNTDGRTIYDVGSGRFYVINQIKSNAFQKGYLHVAVSKNSNPLTSGTADWYFYHLDITGSAGEVPPINSWNDYPGLGVDAQALYVTYNMYYFTTGQFQNCQIIILKKSDINNGIATYSRLFTPDGDANANTLQPATVLGSTSPGNVAYFAETPLYSQTTVRVWAVNDPLGTPSLSGGTSVTIPSNGGSINGAPQLGTTSTLSTLSPKTQGNSFWYSGTLWFCHTAGGSAGRSMIYYYAVRTNGYPSGTPSLAESGSFDGGTGVWNLQPSIGGNAKGDVCLVYTQTSSSIYPTIKFVARRAAATCWESPQTLKVSATFNPSSNSWGDYATVSADPVDNSFWVSHEWVTSGGGFGTYWGNINPAQAIAAPSLISPLNGGCGYSTQGLSWNASPGATSYRVQVSNDGYFTTLVADVPGVSTTSYTVSGLTTSTTYYWRVAGNGTSGTSDWSSVWAFTTNPDPAAPTLASPVNTSVTCWQTVKWNVASNATSYRLQVATNSNFTSPLVDASGLQNTVYSLPPLASGTTYYWKVTAFNSCGNSASSSLWQFTTPTFTGPPAAPGLMQPLNGASDVDCQTFFKWHSVSTACSGYHILVTQSGSTVIDQDVTDTTYFADPGVLSTLTTYNWKVYGKNSFGNGTWSSTRSFTTNCMGKIAVTPPPEEGTPKIFKLAQNHPNPFNPTTRFEYSLPHDVHVTMKIYNTLGQVVATLVDEFETSGYKSVEYDAGSLASGIYFYRLTAGNFTDIKKMVLMK